MNIKSAGKTLMLACSAMLFCLQACVEPFEVVTGGEKQLLVVDGLITDQNDTTLNRVKLAWSAPYNGADNLVLSMPVQGAQVTLHSSNGNVMMLRESYKGNYVLDHYNYNAQQGESYTLTVKLPDGRAYASRPELLTEVPEIHNVGYSYRETTKVVKNGSGDIVEQKEGGFEVFVEVDDPVDTRNYYRWTTEGVFEYYVIAVEIKPTPPSICWSCVGKINNKVAAYDDSRVNGKRISQSVAVVPADIPTRYRTTVRQYSLTPEAHEFWRLLQQQQTSVGSIFDPPPAQIRGNLYSVSDPEEEVFGYFGASGITERSLTINREMHYPFPGRAAYVVPPMPNFVTGCLYMYPNSTAIRPVGF